MSQFENITIILSLMSVIVSGIAALFTYKNLIAIKEQFHEQNRGNILFFIQKDPHKQFHTLIFKNFGNAPAKLISIELNPNLSWSNSKTGLDISFDVNRFFDIFLAPNQFISTEFDLRNFDNPKINVRIKYESCNKEYIENYDIDMSYSNKTLSSETTIDSTNKGLREINRSIRELSDKFL